MWERPFAIDLVIRDCIYIVCDVDEALMEVLRHWQSTKASVTRVLQGQVSLAIISVRYTCMYAASVRAERLSFFRRYACSAARFFKSAGCLAVSSRSSSGSRSSLPAA